MLYSIQNWGDLSQDECKEALQSIDFPVFIKDVIFRSISVNDKIEIDLEIKWSLLFYSLIPASILLISVIAFIGNYWLIPTVLALIVIRLCYSYSKSKLINQLYLATKDKPQNNC